MSAPVTLLPESAPFTEEQRAWLNGFLAGWVGLQSGHGLAAPDPSTIAGAIATDSATIAEPEEDFPWHDPAIAMDERLRMAEAKPLPRRLMAAMAQLDCGSCGYDCQRYAEAIASGEEKSLKLCSPGGKETARKLKELVSLELAASPGNGQANGHTPISSSSSATSTDTSWSRLNPYPAAIRTIRNLNGEGSAKQTSHVEIDLAGSGLAYEVGDSLGVYPTNCSELVQDVLDALGCEGEELLEIDGQSVTLRKAFSDHFCLTGITDELIAETWSRCQCDETRAWLSQVSDNPDLIDGWDVLDLLRKVPPAGWSLADLQGTLTRLKPRLYSISSSLKAFPEQVHLTVGRVSWKHGSRIRKGVASTMFADRMQSGAKVRVFVNKSHGFTVPKDPSAAAIMIGPGTGIAPFRAFLQERMATKATGKNWLFFGDQCSATDFLYRDELESLRQQGVLTRLELAFSRDQLEKIYVQHRLLEHGAEVWNWLKNGAHIYICGDAKRMAVDVDQALRQIVTQCGGKSQKDADAFMSQLTREKRYCRDVY